MFPGNAAGLGLLILRCGVAAQLMLTASRDDHSWRLVVIAASLGLCIGAFHQAVSLLGLACEAMFLKTGAATGLVPEVVHVAFVVGVALLGPGAYSIDAKRFGRRRILPPLG